MGLSKEKCSLERVLRSFDFFGESFTFRYYDEDKHASKLGGVVFIVFMLIAISYLIYNLIPFAKKENFTLQYYTMNLNNTEAIQLAEAPTALAIGITDNNMNNNTQYNISDLFELNVGFITKRKNGTKTKIILDKHNCDNIDFYNLHQKSFEESKIDELNCLNKIDLKSNSLEGIYTDELFSYYEISVESKYKNNETHIQIINDFLIQYDCKLQFYYTDITINLDDHKNPYSSFLNSLFLQLNPTLIQKKNIFLMNYHLYDDDHFFHILDNKEEPINRTGLSRVEDYAVYKGLDRGVMKTEDYSIYAKMYIRVDNKKIEIKRRYQDFMEFFADTTALFSTLFFVLGAIFAYYDRVIANHSISKKLFYFEGIEGNKFDQLRELKKVLTNKEKDWKNATIGIPTTNYSNIQNNNLENNIGNNDTCENIKIEKEIKKNEKKGELINYNSYNIFEMIWSFTSKCCKTKKFENKTNLIKQSNDLIDDKLDIIFYIKNMFLFQSINRIYLENKTIINFLSSPIIYLDEEKCEEKNKYEQNKINISKISQINDVESSEEGDSNNIRNSKIEQYNSVKKIKSDKLNKKIAELVMKNNKTKPETRLINYLERRLEGL
jgi:hypothetical protein